MVIIFSFTEPLVGAVAGLTTIVCFFCIKFADHMHWDDALDVGECHGMGGFLGTLAIGFLASPMTNGIHASLHQFGIQLFRVLLVAIYAMLVTFIILVILDKITHIRITKE